MSPLWLLAAGGKQSIAQNNRFVIGYFMLTLEMATAGLIAGLCQFAAHHLMRERQYATCVPRYIVGSAIVCACFAGGFWLNAGQEPVTALIYLYGASLIGTRAGYATDPKPLRRQRPNATDLDKWAATVVAEHSDDGPERRD